MQRRRHHMSIILILPAVLKWHTCRVSVGELVFGSLETGGGEQEDGTALRVSEDQLLTDPDQVDFVKDVKVDALAIAMGQAMAPINSREA